MALISKVAQDRFTKDFHPKGRTHAVIYAVTLKAQPGVVKIGRTKSWSSRRNSYASWNLAPGDGIDEERLFILTEDYVDLVRLERGILRDCPFPLRSGSEWFTADLEDVVRYIDRFLCNCGLSYV